MLATLHLFHSFRVLWYLQFSWNSNVSSLRLSSFQLVFLHLNLFLLLLFLGRINHPRIKASNNNNGEYGLKFGIGYLCSSPRWCHFMQVWIRAFEFFHAFLVVLGWRRSRWWWTCTARGAAAALGWTTSSYNTAIDDVSIPNGKHWEVFSFRLR